MAGAQAAGSAGSVDEAGGAGGAGGAGAAASPQRRAEMTATAGGSVITLSRAPGGWRDRLRRYQVMIDGEQVATIKHGERLELPVPPGRHTVYLQISWARSPQLEVAVAPGDVVSLECAPSNVPPFGPGAEAYIELRRTG
jgi:hypothetical protein